MTESMFSHVHSALAHTASLSLQNRGSACSNIMMCIDGAVLKLNNHVVIQPKLLSHCSRFALKLRENSVSDNNVFQICSFPRFIFGAICTKASAKLNELNRRFRFVHQHQHNPAQNRSLFDFCLFIVLLTILKVAFVQHFLSLTLLQFITIT